MGKRLDKNLVLDRIKEAYKLRGNSKLADLLDVAPNTITNWYNRQTLDYDRIFTKCELLNLEWLLFGEGEIYKKKETPSDPKRDDPDLVMHKDYKIEYIGEMRNMIDLQNKMIASLQEFIRDKDRMIEGLKSGEIIYHEQKKETI